MTPDEIRPRLEAHAAVCRQARLYYAPRPNLPQTLCNLRGAVLSWTSHALLSEILWRAADTELRRMVAAYHGHSGRRCASCKAVDTETGSLLLGLLAKRKDVPVTLRQAARETAERMGVK